MEDFKTQSKMKRKNELQELEDLQEKINEIRKEIISFRDIKIPFGHKLEVGKWYKSKSKPKFMFCFNGKYYDSRNNNDTNLGFDTDGNWKSLGVWQENNIGALADFIPATDKEVEDALIAEAIKRGFKNGVRVISARGEQWNIENDIFDRYNKKTLYLDSVSIFENGKWAEIIEDIKPKINGYEMEVEGDYIKFGCEKYRQDDIIDFYKLAYKIGLTSFSIFGDYTPDYRKIRMGELKEIVEYLNK